MSEYSGVNMCQTERKGGRAAFGVDDWWMVGIGAAIGDGPLAMAMVLFVYSEVELTLRLPLLSSSSFFLLSHYCYFPFILDSTTVHS